jgi:hypothetical protein
MSSDPQVLHLLEQLLEKTDGDDSEKLSDRAANTVDLQNPAGDISTGRETLLANNDSYTLYLAADGDVDVSVELSPDSGTTTYAIPESPIPLTADDDEVVRISYDSNWMRVTGSNNTPVKAQVREII